MTQLTLPAVPPARRRPVGRRCASKHRAAWALVGGWLWCPECGALCPKDVPDRRAWAYPGDVAAADDVSDGWAEARKASS